MQIITTSSKFCEHPFSISEKLGDAFFRLNIRRQSFEKRTELFETERAVFSSFQIFLCSFVFSAKQPKVGARERNSEEPFQGCDPPPASLEASLLPFSMFPDSEGVEDPVLVADDASTGATEAEDDEAATPAAALLLFTLPLLPPKNKEIASERGDRKGNDRSSPPLKPVRALPFFR